MRTFLAVANDIDEKDFERAVLARSRELPVVVDFWAEWCGPCRMLGPALEKEVEALGGRVELVKIDVDRNQGLASSFGIASIPAVKAFRDGKIVAAFEGARDRRFLGSWLRELSPSPARVALERAAAAGDEAGLRVLIADGEVGTEARTALARLLLGRGKPDDVPAVLEGLDTPEADVLRRRLQFAADAAAFGGESAARAALDADPDNVEARWALASALAARGDVAGALEVFLDIVSRNRKLRDDGARRAMLALFEELGPKSDLASDYRRRLQIVT